MPMKNRAAPGVWSKHNGGIKLCRRIRNGIFSSKGQAWNRRGINFNFYGRAKHTVKQAPGNLQKELLLRQQKLLQARLAAVLARLETM